jgi:predicted  nucleic acid-binding Zn-ribbon protein
MNESIKQLLNVQGRDSELDGYRMESAAIPKRVASLKAEIQANKTALENAKKDLMQFQVAKKQKDLDLETREAAIRKHSGELNAVKTNEAYRALVGEIDKAKADKSTFEDEVLVLMDQIDQANKVWKEKESTAKSIESGLQTQIGTWEAKQKEFDDLAGKKLVERDELLNALPVPLRESYERLRQSKRNNAVVPIRNGQCTGCHMKVSPNLINEISRGKKLMACESCARIVYLEETPAAEPAAVPATEIK